MMKIDRHNYEEFFILYWDDELSVSQKQAVENFVKENTDLQEEFTILRETRFTPDKNVQLEEKEFLLNTSFINITNYEEQLINYIDDELSNEERKEIETSAAKYPTIQKELTLLQKTKLQPEAEVIFPDKTTLYKREEKVRVISMTWFRVAVAAAIILIAGFATLKLVTTPKNGENSDVVNNTNSKNSNPVIDPQADQLPNSQPPDLVKTNEKTAPVQPGIEKKGQKPVPENKRDNTIAVYKDGNKNKLPKERTRTNQPVQDQNNSIDKALASSEEIILPSKDNDKVEKSGSNKTNPDVTLQPGYALNIQEPDESVTTSEDKQKGGLKEFLRKTTRVFERRTKIQATTEDNKLLVGAFAVSLK